ncbi:endo-beta-N-acetylglucosaminidase [Streptomyces luteireticuli]|uniref:endo-beta-N-acetylglucosaminidase n=1 Tax=Streptomyces luteireticuli TaxID=173858 RepID=UPI00355934A2
MNPTRRHILLTATAAAVTGPLAPAHAHTPCALPPHTPYWFPDSLPPGAPPPGVTWRSLARWRPEDDADLPFNTSTVPLANRFPAGLRQAQISALVSFAPTSGNPSQGAPTADSYAFTHWAYLDELVFWGGSSGEGLVVAPSAPVVDAAHRNGVPVLGTVFLPPTAYGGRLEWTRDLVRRARDGRFPLADQLVRVARTHRFDGWFVNAETGGGDRGLGTDMRDFIAYLKARGRPHGLRVTWYDAMTTTGDIDWRNELDDRNAAFFRAADSMFVNFNWTRSGLRSSGELAERLGRDRYELWAGVDVEARGRDTPVDWDAIAPPDGAPHVTSYGFYRPEWTWKSAPRDDPAAFHARDDRFWLESDGTWRAPAAVVAGRSTLTALPFATTFNTGHGLGWWEEGRRVSDRPWSHPGLQDRLPARRDRSVRFDFADAWRGGSSLLVDADTDTVGLFTARLPLSPATVIELTHRADPGASPVRAELAVTVAGHTSYLPIPEPGPGWTTAVLRIGGTDGRRGGTIDALGIRLRGSRVRWRLGRLAVRDAAPAAPARPGTPAVTASAVAPDGTAALRVTWPASRSRGVRHYVLHQSLPGGGTRFLGGTCGHAYYVPALIRPAGEAVTRIEVRAVDELYASSAPAPFLFHWPRKDT